jgi:hypothetical protein
MALDSLLVDFHAVEGGHYCPGAVGRRWNVRPGQAGSASPRHTGYRDCVGRSVLAAHTSRPACLFFVSRVIFELIGVFLLGQSATEFVRLKFKGKDRDVNETAAWFSSNVMQDFEIETRTAKF